MAEPVSRTKICNYYVDEAGDGNLFNRKGEVILGTPGCSNYFILGLLEVDDPLPLSTSLGNLRNQLLSDPYFKGVPSMQPDYKKTARYFHAKDDLPEVRREVMSLLRDHPGLRFFAVVKDKKRVLEYVRSRNQLEPAYRYNPNELYDHLVRRLFRDRLHKKDQYNIYFARRGKSDRTAALNAAIASARHHFQDKWGKDSVSQIQVIPTEYLSQTCLQAVDYFTWSLQRLYERREQRYVEYLWSKFHLVVDIDDTRKKEYGAYYSQKAPLTLDALKGH